MKHRSVPRSDPDAAAARDNVVLVDVVGHGRWPRWSPAPRPATAIGRHPPADADRLSRPVRHAVDAAELVRPQRTAAERE